MSPPTSLSPPTSDVASTSPLDDCYVPRRLRARSGSVDLRQHEKLQFEEKDEARVRKHNMSVQLGILWNGSQQTMFL